MKAGGEAVIKGISSFLSPLLISSASVSPAHAHLTTPRVIAAKPGPGFNEAVLRFALERQRLKQTPLCDVHVSHLLLPRSLPFLNY